MLSNAVKIVFNAARSEKQLPLISSPDIPQMADFVLRNRVFYVVLLALLISGYLLLWRSPTWYLVTGWGLIVIPVFLLFFGYQDFFDRVLLFLLMPCALSFAEAGAKVSRLWPKLQRPFALGLTALVLWSASISYFWIEAVDRITPDEVAAARYLAALHRPISVYTNGFGLPVSTDLTFISADRGVLRAPDILRADAVVVSAQLKHAVLLQARSPLGLEDLAMLLQQNYDLVYTNGDTQIFVKRNSALGENLRAH